MSAVTWVNPLARPETMRSAIELAQHTGATVAGFLYLFQMALAMLYVRRHRDGGDAQ